MEPIVKVTRITLARALADWEAEAAAQHWPARTDDQRHLDNADYLIGLIQTHATAGAAG